MAGEPEDFVEVTVTFLVPVTDQNRHAVDAEVCDMIDANWSERWAVERVAHYVKDAGQVLRLDYKIPWTRWKASRRR